MYHSSPALQKNCCHSTYASKKVTNLLLTCAT